MRLFKALSIEEVQAVNEHIRTSARDLDTQRLYNYINQLTQKYLRARKLIKKHKELEKYLPDTSINMSTIIMSMREKLIALFETKHDKEGLDKKLQETKIKLQKCSDAAILKICSDFLDKIDKNKTPLDREFKDVSKAKTLIIGLKELAKNIKPIIKSTKDKIIEILDLIYLIIPNLAPKLTNEITKLRDTYRDEFFLGIYANIVKYINNAMNTIGENRRNKPEEYSPQMIKFKREVNKKIIDIITIKTTDAATKKILEKIQKHSTDSTIMNLRNTLQKEFYARRELAHERNNITSILNNLRQYLNNNQDENDFALTPDMREFLKTTFIYNLDLLISDDVSDKIINMCIDNENAEPAKVSRQHFIDIIKDVVRLDLEAKEQEDEQVAFFNRRIKTWSVNIPRYIYMLFEDCSFMKARLAGTFIDFIDFMRNFNLISAEQDRQMHRNGLRFFSPNPSRYENPARSETTATHTVKELFPDESDSEASDSEAHEAKRRKLPGDLRKSG